MLTPLIIAAPSSGCGKTTVTLGLMAALKRRGLEVAPFKVGPDYIDPGLHAVASGRISRNLDGWMCGEEGVRSAYARGCQDADVAVVEGVMGLFDGATGDSNVGSTAEIAGWLNGRIILVVDARSQARSAAALVSGFSRFDPELQFAGIIFNRVGSDRHQELLRQACSSVAGLPPVLGCIRRDEEMTLPERHLGLLTAEEGALDSGFLTRLADVVEAAIDIDAILDLPSSPKSDRGGFEQDEIELDLPLAKREGKPVWIGVARDKAFCFYYPDNLELLRAAGAELVEFSPLTDAKLPADLDGLYFGGGYPEVYAEELAQNGSMLAAVRDAADAGIPIYAECGGLIYLAEAIEPQAVTGIFPATVRMLPKRKALGYREVTLQADTLLGPAGTVLRGHEFHYSEIEMPEEVHRVYRVSARNGQETFIEGYASGNVLGSYIHLHFGSNPQVADNFVAACRNKQ